jgi:hypothetical protein
MSSFHADPTRRQAVLCAGCKADWEELLRRIAARWHDGLRSCFVCLRPLGDQLFPARSPLGTVCAHCALAFAVQGSDGMASARPFV